MMPETEFILYGISKQSYKFKVYPINIELPSDFGGLYVYTNYTSNGIVSLQTYLIALSTSS